jgi:antitoxin HigA-1
MIEMLNTIKGIHPGHLLEKELKCRQWPKRQFALSIGAYPQTLGAIMKGHRSMNTVLALKIEQALGWEEGFLMVVQVYYDIEQAKQKQASATPDLTKIRAILFWDTNINTINWIKQKNAVIRRVLERGNADEQAEIRRFYGIEAVDKLPIPDEV